MISEHIKPLTPSSLRSPPPAAEVVLTKGLGHQYQSGMFRLAGVTFHLEYRPQELARHDLCHER